MGPAMKAWHNPIFVLDEEACRVYLTALAI